LLAFVFLILAFGFFLDLFQVFLGLLLSGGFWIFIRVSLLWILICVIYLAFSKLIGLLIFVLPIIILDKGTELMLCMQLDIKVFDVF